MKGNSEESRTLNTYLDILKSRIYEIQKDLIHSGKKLMEKLSKIYFWELMKESECSFRFSKSIITEWKRCGKRICKRNFDTI
jgi:hypothetical protein